MTHRHPRTIVASLIGMLLVASLVCFDPAFAEGLPAAGRMPTLSASTLADRAVTLPADLPGEKTLVLMAYDRKQQADLDTWIVGLRLREGTRPWVEVPVIGRSNAFVRGMIDAGMRRGIPDVADRDRTITLAVDAVSLRAALALEGDVDQVDLMVIDRSGLVRVRARGPYALDKSKALLDAMAR